MVNRSQMSERLASYLNGRVNVDAFEDWIISNSWNIHLTEDFELMNFAYEIQELLNEHSLLHLNELRLKELLKPVLYSMKSENVIQVDLSEPHGCAFLSGQIMERSQRVERTSVRDYRLSILQA